MYRPHILAMDLDGVLLRHPQLQSHVARRAVAYVQQHAPLALSESSAVELNRRLYTAHGHTWRGMKKEMGYAQSGTLQQYNEWVYEDDVLQALESMYKDVAIRTQGREAIELSRACRDRQIPIVIFSNAPTAWVIGALEVLGMPCQVIVGSDHPIFMQHLVKPDGMVYQNLTHYLHKIFQHPTMKIHFVDDTCINLQPVLHHPRWNPILFDPHTSTPQTQETIERIASIADILRVLDAHLDRKNDESAVSLP